MAIRQFLAAVRQHLWSTVIGVVLTLVAAAVVFSTEGVYYSRVEVTVEEPIPTPGANPYLLPNRSLVTVALAVSRVVNQDVPARDDVSIDTRLSGQGIRSGYLVRVPNSGNQWVFEYRRPVLVVESVGRTEAEASRLMSEALDRIQSVVTSLQDDSVVREPQRIRLSQSPSEPVISYVGGSRIRGLGGTLLLGVGVTAAAVVLAWRRGVARAYTMPVASSVTGA